MTEAVEHSMYCLATDVLDEGAAMVLDKVEDLGMRGLTVAAKYHSVADVYPHNPVRKLASLAPGLYYPPDLSRYEDGLVRPQQSPSSRGRNVLEEVCSAAAGRGMEVAAWIVLLHHDEAGLNSTGLQVNCFGDEMPATLCPAHPEVRLFAASVVQDIASYPVKALRIESCHFHGLSHGHHHERLLDSYGAASVCLLGLCFCQWCIERAEEAGVDAQRVAAQSREFLEGVFSGRLEPAGSDAGSAVELVGDEMGAYLARRQHTVLSLIVGLSDKAAQMGVRVSVIEQSLANRGYATGEGRTGERDAILQYGVDSLGLRRAGVRTEITGYLREASELEQVLAPHCDVSGGGLAVVLRPGAPDCASTEELREKIGLAEAAGAAEVNFYAYGLYRWPILERVRAAIT